MHKIARKLSAAVIAIFTAFTALSYMPASAAVVAPKVQYVSAPQLEYTAGDRVQFNLNAPNYGGRVQYRVVLWDNNKKQMRDLWTSGDRYYTNWQPYGNETFTLGWPISEPGSYRITIYAKRAGVANSKTALKGYNCDSYMESAAFVVKPAAPAVDTSYETAVKAVASYETAPLTTLDQVTAAEGLKAAAATAVASVSDAVKKAELNTRVAAQDKKVADAKAQLSVVKVLSVSGINKNTIKVVFDKEVGQVTAKNFKIYAKNNEYATLFAEKVTVNKDTVTLNLYDNLAVDTDYSVEVSNVSSVDGKATMSQTATQSFTYTEAAAASIAFTGKSFITGDEIGYVIKDANGNDITNNFAFAADMSDPQDNEIVLQTSDEDVVGLNNDGALEALSQGYSVVNLKIQGTNVETGNTIVSVKDAAAAKLVSVAGLSIGTENFENPQTFLYLGAEANTAAEITPELHASLLDQDGKDALGTVTDTIETTYKSLTPTVAIVSAEGDVTPVSAGTATVLVTSTQKDAEGNIIAKVNKTFTITVKADPKAATLKIDQTSLNLVAASEIEGKVNVSVLDQYGNPFLGADSVTVTLDKSSQTYIDAPDSELALTDGKAALEINPLAKGTVKVTFAYGTLAKQTLTVNVVEHTAFAGYVVVPESTTLDLFQPAESDTNYDTLKKLVQGPAEFSASVYMVDTNGNKYADVTSDAVIASDDNNDVLNGMTAAKVGTEKVTVKINTVTVATYTVKVVDSEPALAKVVVNGDTLSIASDADLTAKLFGDEDHNYKNGLIVGYDQYGNVIKIAADDSDAVQIFSTDSSVVSSDLSVGGSGKATLVIKIAGNIYTVDVAVK